MLDPIPEDGYFFDRDMADPVGARIAGGQAVVLSRRCPGREPPNEDAAALVPLSDSLAVLLVADGFGGHPAGEEAASLALRLVTRSVREAWENSEAANGGNAFTAGETGPPSADEPAPDDLRGPILAGIDAANLAVMGLGVGAATTLVALEIRRNRIRPYHVGDSEVLVTGQRGKLKLRTLSHSPAGYAVEAGVVDPDDAMHHEERHLVSNMVGSPEMRIEVGAPLRLAPLDTVIVGSDGLFDNLTEDEITELARKGPLPEAVAAMATLAGERMRQPAPNRASKPDDLTIVAFRLH
jgi:serine/threonine protein phosphatase PrpC